MSKGYVSNLGIGLSVGTAGEEPVESIGPIKSMSGGGVKVEVEDINAVNGDGWQVSVPLMKSNEAITVEVYVTEGGQGWDLYAKFIEDDLKALNISVMYTYPVIEGYTPKEYWRDAILMSCTEPGSGTDNIKVQTMTIEIQPFGKPILKGELKTAGYNMKGTGVVLGK